MPNKWFVQPRRDCGPIVLDGVAWCPEGNDLTPKPCWNCRGSGCKWCQGTGSMSACKECLALEALCLNMVRIIDDIDAMNSRQIQRDQLEQEERRKIEKLPRKKPVLDHLPVVKERFWFEDYLEEAS